VGGEGFHTSLDAFASSQALHPNPLEITLLPTPTPKYSIDLFSTWTEIDLCCLAETLRALWETRKHFANKLNEHTAKFYKTLTSLGNKLKQQSALLFVGCLFFVFLFFFCLLSDRIREEHLSYKQGPDLGTYPKLRLFLSNAFV